MATKETISIVTTHIGNSEAEMVELQKNHCKTCDVREKSIIGIDQTPEGWALTCTTQIRDTDLNITLIRSCSGKDISQHIILI